MNDKRGSIWRKWDLHVHTPESYHQHFGDDWDTYVTSLKNKAEEHDIEVAVIMDYFSVGGYEKLVEEYCEEKFPCPSLLLGSGKKLYLIPGMELRLSIFDHDENALNLHLIFDPKILPGTIRSSFIEKLTINYLSKKLLCKSDDLIKIGDAIQNDGKYEENLNIGGLADNVKKQLVNKALSIITLDVDDLDEGLNKLQINLQGISESSCYLKLVAYKGHGSLSGYKWYDQNYNEGRAGNIKARLLNYTDLCFSNDPKDVAFLLGKNAKTPANEIIARFGNIKPCVWGSDSHSFNTLFHPSNGATKDYTWIKSDPTFEGLKQILYEPEERVWIGEIPPKLNEVDRNKELYLDKISITSTEDKNEWFDRIAEIPLNAGLVSIIGNKGSGKSALADAIALACNTNNKAFSFLKDGKFLDLHQRSKYSASVCFKDNYQCKVKFEEQNVNKGNPEKAIYLSQSFVNSLCDTNEGLSKLQEQINVVVFSYLPQEFQLRQNSIEQLIRIKNKGCDDIIRQEFERLNEINNKIADLEELLKPEYREKIDRQKKELQRRLSELEAHPPNPVSSPSNVRNEVEILKITRWSTKNKSLALLETELQEELNVKLLNIKELEDLRDDLSNFRTRYEELKNRVSGISILKNYSNSKDIISFAFNSDLMEEILTKERNKSDEVARKLAKCRNLVIKIESYVEKLQQSLDSEQQAYQSYIQEQEIWLDKQKEIKGSERDEDTLLFIEKRILYISNELKVDIENALCARNSFCKKIAEQLIKKKEIFATIYSHVQEEANKKADYFKIPYNEFIEFNSNIKISSDFHEQFFSYIHQNKKGTYYAEIEENKVRLDGFLRQLRFDSADNLVAAAEFILSTLTHNIKLDPERVNEEYASPVIDHQLKRDKIDFYNYLFSLQYVVPEINITYDSKNIRQLSPGEKGILLLIFYLVIDKDNRPIIIDQPEENLDNETVFTRLVKIIKDTKKRRQVLIVTHNPNLAIVCDSEQLIYANMDKKNLNLITYESGGIENEVMKDYAIKILEGTKPAFNNRKFKYED